MLIVFTFLSLLTSGFSTLTAETSSRWVYLTWQHDPQTSMTLQWISEGSNNQDVEFQKAGDKDWNRIKATLVTLPRNSQNYNLHRVELKNLNPDTIYKFRIDSSERIYRFHTLPICGTKPLRFVVGGDMYHEASGSPMEQTCRTASKTNPMFALLGGDLAYSGSKFPFMRENFSRWLTWLKIWQDNMVTEEGCLIPMIPAIGNHETNGWFDQSPKQAPFFYTLFLSGPAQGYRVLDFGNYLSLFLLDSGHTHPVEGEQTHWLNQALDKRQNIPHKFAIYHVPAYPSHGHFKNKVSAAIRNHWVPIFERFRLQAAFENHCHTYKRSHPILMGKVNEKGILYLGDGAWGVSKTRLPKTPENSWYIAKSASVRHFILVTLDGPVRLFQAIDSYGNLVDSYKQ